MYLYKDDLLSRIEETPENTVQIDVMSDLHLDFHLRFSDEVEMKREVRNFIKNRRDELKIKSDEVLIVAGDISHHNSTSNEFLQQLSSIWKYVLVIPGNHEWYIQDKKDDRYESLIKSLDNKDNIVFLMDRVDVFEYKGVKIAGTIMFYNLDKMLNYVMWKSIMSDARFMTRKFVQERNKRDIAYYNKVINEVDVFVSHVPIVNLDGKAATDNLFLNKDVLPVKDVLYISGHTHNPTDSIAEGLETPAVNVAYGYPYEVSNGAGRRGAISVHLASKHTS